MQMKEHMGHPILTVYITQKEKFIEVRQFHHRTDGKIGYGLYPYTEDEKGHWRENLTVGLWIYREDFQLLYEGIKEVYPRKETGFEDFDDTGMNFINKPEWKVILNHWDKIAINNPSSAEFIDYVSRWVIATLEQVDEIAIEPCSTYLLHFLFSGLGIITLISIYPYQIPKLY
ncbi:hypothetical protein ACJ7K1_13735 [Paenibacillus elgii]